MSMAILGELARDVRYSLRMMRNAPGFTLVAALSLAVGVGANTAMFTVADAVLLGTLQVAEPERLVLFEWEAGQTFRHSGAAGIAPPVPLPSGRKGRSLFHQRLFQAMRRLGAPCDLFAFAELPAANIMVDGRTEVADGQYVSGNYFAALGVKAILGRTLVEQDDDPAAEPVAIISYQYWQSRLGGRPDMLGRRIVVNNVAFSIVGVAPPEYTGTLQVGSRPVVNVPIAFEPLVAAAGVGSVSSATGRWWLHVMGRLAAGATAQQARDSLNGAFQSLALEMMPPPRRPGQSGQAARDDYPNLVVHSGRGGVSEMRRKYSLTIYPLFGAVGLVLIIACANVANMLLARSAVRRSEITVRLSLGAARGRLIRQLMVESVMLAILGGLLALGIAFWGKDAIGTLAADGLLPSTLRYELGWRVLGFTFLVCLVTALLFGLVPALRATAFDLASTLKQGQRTSVSRSRLSWGLLVAEVAISMVLLLGAGLFLRTVRSLGAANVGYDESRLLVFSLAPEGLGYRGDGLERLYDQVFARLAGVPGALNATFMSTPLLSKVAWMAGVRLPGESGRSGLQLSTARQVVHENHFDTLAIPLLRGRRFVPQDRKGAPLVAIVSETFVRRFFPDQPGAVIGQRIGLEGGSDVEIVGVAGDARYGTLRAEMWPLVYTPWRQESSGLGRMFFAVRSASDPGALVGAIHQAVREVHAGLPVTDVGSQMEQARRAYASERLFAKLLTFFGALAALLAAVGLYAVMAYSVSQRTREIAVRMALGAQTSAVVRLIISKGLKIAAMGMILGGLGALALRKVIESRLYGVRGTDPLTFILAAGCLLVVTVMACWIPTRRATRVHPGVALRSQ
jgi:predicted permease